MMPIQDLLNRIRWDEAFGHADFRIGYYDRIQHSLVLKALADIRFPEDSHSVFEWNDSEGEAHTIPLHRIKAVYRNIVPVLPVGIYKIVSFAHAIAMLIGSRPFRVRYAGLERAPLFQLRLSSWRRRRIARLERLRRRVTRPVSMAEHQKAFGIARRLGLDRLSG